jgi:hypothetical protein
MVYKTITMVYNQLQDDLQCLTKRLQWFTINCKMIYNDLQNNYHDLQSTTSFRRLTINYNHILEHQQPFTMTFTSIYNSYYNQLQ